MARPPIIWTDEMLDDLETYYPITRDEILAEWMKISVGTIRRKAKELKLCKTTNFHYNYEVWNLVKSKHGSATVKEIAKEAGVSERTVYRIVKRLRLELDEQRRSEIYSEAARKMIRREHSRMTFGFGTRIHRPLGKNRERREIAKRLTSYGYIVTKGSLYVYYSESLPRHKDIEAEAKNYGYELVLWGKE